MARWARPEPANINQRRKWNLGDRTSLRNLHGNSTENGDSNSQYEIARQILEDDAAEDARADYSLGIDWLLKASYEGHQGALMLLAKSLKTGRGINDRNITEVETCLAMTQSERNARKAARELFNCLKQTNNSGEHYITVAQLEKKMRQIYKLKSSRFKMNSSSKTTETSSGTAQSEQDISPYHSIRPNILSSPGNNISEENLISAAMQVVHGQLPNISSSLTLSVPHPESLNHVPYFHRMLFHPLLFLYLIYHQYLNALARFPSSLSNCIIFLLILSYTTTINNVLAFLPVVIYHVSLFVMFVSTLKMIKSKHRYDDFRIWSQLFLSFDQQFDTNAENAFLRKELQPYLIYFSAFFVNVIVSPTIPLPFRMTSEVTIISFILLFVTLFLFMFNNRNPFPDLPTLLSFGINVLVKYPFEIDAEMWSNWLILDLKIPTFAPFPIGNGIEFCFNCRGLLYLLLPALLITLARRHNWHGIYQCLIPHCVVLSWLQICIISSQSATIFEMVRGTLTLAGMLFCLPLFGLVTLMIPVFVTVESMALKNAVHRLVASVSFAGVALITSCLLASYRRTKRYVTYMQVIVCVMATLIHFTHPYISKYFEVSPSDSQSDIYQTIINRINVADSLVQDEVSINYLKWDLFNRHCYSPLLYPGNRVNTQLKCDRFHGSPVKWEGSVHNIEIRRVSNIFEKVLTFLPEFISNPVICWFGEPNELMFDVYDPDDLEYFKEQNKCNLNSWNTYEFRIGIKLDYSPIEVYLNIHYSEFTNFTRLLNRADRIWFTGTLFTSYTNPHGNDDVHVPFSIFNLEKYPLWIDVTSIGCIKCKETSLKAFYASNNLKLSSRNIYNGIKYLLNVLFNPLIKIN